MGAARGRRADSPLRVIGGMIRARGPEEENEISTLFLKLALLHSRIAFSAPPFPFFCYLQKPSLLKRALLPLPQLTPTPHLHPS
jgi:hypothetical protein